MRKLLFFINVDWYYRLHWQERILSSMTDGYEVHVCMASESNVGAESGLADEFEGRPIRHHSIAMHRTSAGAASNLRALTGLRRILREIEPDLVHTVTIKPNLLGGVLTRRARTPILMTLPGLGSVFSDATPRNRILRRSILATYRWIAGNPHARFVFENAADRELFRRERVLSPGAGTLSPGSGVDLERFRPTDDPPPVEPLTVLFAARLLRQKGLEDLVAAARLRRERGQAIRLLVAGIQDPSAPDPIPLSQIESWHADGDIEWLGRSDDMAGLLAKVHLVALPTKYGEGIPRILIEAAACGVPALTTDLGGCGEFVVDGTTGRTVAPSDVEQLAAALADLGDSQARSRMGRAARTRVEESYSRARVIEVFRGLYEELAPPD